MADHLRRAVQGREIFSLSSRTVTTISRKLVPLTSLPFSAALVVASAVCLVFAFFDGLGSQLREFVAEVRLVDIGVALATYISSVFVHEFGHAALCLKKTGLVGSITVRLSRGLPVFATDVSSLHLSS
jgi:uncharacterized protein (DUF486 family)